MGGGGEVHVGALAALAASPGRVEELARPVHRLLLPSPLAL